MTGSPPRRRADAERSRQAILDAATRLLAQRPDAGMSAIAAEARVTRQTVYAHFASRDDLTAAVTDYVTDKALAAVRAADPDSGSATEALLRLLEASWQAFEELPALQHVIAATEADRQRHIPVTDHLVRLIRRGQRAGEFDPAAKPEWLAAAIIGLGHAAGEEVRAHRMSLPEAEKALRESVLRVTADNDAVRPGTGTPDTTDPR